MAIALGASSASAQSAREYKEDFGPVQQPIFNHATAIAVDQGTGDLYVADLGNEVQSLTVSASEGQFRLRFEGEETTDINFNSSETTVQSRLRALAAIGNPNVVVAGGPGDAGGSSPYIVTFQRDLEATDVPEIECVDGTTPLSGGSGCTVETVTEGAPHAVRRFNSDGTAKEFPALGSNAIDGQGAGDETPEGGILSNPGNGLERHEVQIAVDESETATDGDIYVTDWLNNVIDIFSEDGEFIGQLSEYENESAEVKPLGNTCAVAVDGDGDIYVGDFTNKAIHKYEPAADPPTNADHVTSFTEATTGIERPCGLSAGAGPSEGALFVTRFRGSVYKLDAETGASQYQVVEYPVNSGAATTSVDPVSGHLLVAVGDEANEYDATGPSEAVLKLQSEPGATVQGLAANGAAKELYLSLEGRPNVEIWSASGAPIVESLPATGLTGTSATLNGAVNPKGEPLTDCAFEWGETTAYGQGADCVPGPGGIGAGESPVAVGAGIEGLEPGTVYHFRLSAANGPEPGDRGFGADLSFQTPGAALGESWAQEVTETEATLKAEIDLKGKATVYRFEYGANGPCSANPCAHIPVPDREVGDDEATHDVSESLTGLKAATTYHWRVVATDEDEVVSEGPDKSFDTYAPLAHGPCPNDALRAPPSDALPDCRAYEMVSPVDKNGGDIVVSSGIEASLDSAYRQSSPTGDRVTYTSTAVFAGALRSTKANQYLAARGAGGWSTDALYPPQGTTVFDPNFNSQYDFNTNFQAFTPDLCHALMRDHNQTPLTEEAIAGFTNLYLRDNCGAGAGSYEALTVGGAPAFSEDGVNLGLQGRTYSADLEHIVFGTTAALDSTPTASGSENSIAPQLYDLHDGALILVSVLPGGGADPRASFVGSAAGGSVLEAARQSNLDRAVSADGSRIFWSSANSGGLGGNVAIYLRLNPAGDTTEECSTPTKACTIAVSEAGGEDVFWTADTGGSKAIFSEGQDLYELDVDAALAEEPAKTPIAGELGGVVGASEDLSRLYFTSTEALAPGATEGEPNLYLRREGVITLVARLAAGDVAGLFSDYRLDASIPIQRAARVAPDGEGLAFMSRSPELAAATAGIDNRDKDTGEPVAEIYLFDAGGEGELRCASCNPSGGRPDGRAPHPPYRQSGAVDFTAAAWLPTCEWTNYCKRALSASGERLFFNSFDSLLPEDRNDAQDVYEWEVPGSGTCTTSNPRYFPRNGGCLHLISTGASKEDSEFTDASANGSDAFFTTASDIDPRDEAFIDLYDARVGGGFPPPEPEADPCVGDACQSVPPAPEAPAPTSEGYAGPGNEARSSGGCARPARRAKALARKAKRARRAARRSSAPRRSRALRRRARKVARKAKQNSNAAKRCRRRGRAGR